MNRRNRCILLLALAALLLAAPVRAADWPRCDMHPHLLPAECSLAVKAVVFLPAAYAP